MKTLPFILALAFCGCAPKAIVVEPVAPVAARAHTLAKASSVAATAVTKATTEAATATTSLGWDVSKMVDALDAQRKNASIPPEVSEMNFQMAVKVAALAVEAERRTESARLAAVDAVDKAENTEDATEDAVKAAVKGDKVTAEVVKQNIKLGEDAAIGRGVKAVMWGVAIILALAAFLVFSKSGAKVAARLYSPFK